MESPNMFQVKLNPSFNVENCSLIVPTVCVGNVAQLAADLLINTLNTVKIGYIYTSLLHPLVGSEAFSGGADLKKGNISTACEIFKCEDLPLCIIQQRSPILKGRSKEFCARLSSWIKECGFKKVVIMTGSFSHQRNDSQLALPSMCRFFTSFAASEDKNLLKSQLNWELLDLCHDSQDEFDMSKPTILGSGIAQALLKQCDNIDAIACLIYCSEGNNCPEAAALAFYVYQWLRFYFQEKHLSEVLKWKTPISWQHMFGRSVSKSLF